MHRLPTLPRRIAGLAILAAGLAAAAPAGAAAVDVQVTDGAGRPLPGAVVFLESPAARAAARPLEGIEIEQAAKRFSQRLTVVPVGSEVGFPNRDKVRHHVFSFSPAKTFEIKLYAGTPANPVRFDRPGVVVLGCNIHDSMVAWVLVVETPYFAQTDAQGRLALPEVPAGDYRLRAWHPDLPPGTPPLEQPLSVAGARTAASAQLALGAR
jgi:plastocyanin